MLYRIFTELKNKESMLDLVNAKFDGFTAYETTGFWRGTQEQSICFEILTEKGEDVMNLANEIKEANQQESVLVEAFESSSIFV